MANFTIADIATSATSLGDADLLEIEQSGVSKKITGDKINVAPVTHAASSKATPVDADELPITDSAASYALKKLAFADLAGWIWTKLGPLIAAGTGKTTPIDADSIALSDSAASDASKKVTLTNLKAFLKTYFDTLYAAVGGGGTPAGSTKQVQYNNAGAFGAEAGFEYDASTNVLKAPSTDFGDPTTFGVNGISGDDPHWINITNAPASGGGKQLMRFNGYGAGAYAGNVHFCRYRGTEAAPTAVQSGDTFSSFGWRGWDSSAALSQSAASWAVVATENWTGSAHGIKMLWQITANGSTTRANGMELTSAGLAVTGAVSATGAVTGSNLSGTNTGDASSAAVTQTAEMIAGYIGTAADKTYKIVVKAAHAGTITETTTISESGTCTATFKINTTALGGTANSVGSSEQSQAQASSNVFSAGDDIQITVSSNSTCLGLSFSIKYTRVYS